MTQHSRRTNPQQPGKLALLSACCMLSLPMYAQATNAIGVDNGNAIFNISDSGDVVLEVTSGVALNSLAYTLTSNGVQSNGVLEAVTGSVSIRSRDGQDTIKLNDLNVAETLQIVTGRANDVIELDQVTVGGQLYVFSGRGQDTVMATNTTVSGETRLSTGRGADAVYLDGTFDAQTNLFVGTGRGTDFVSIEGSEETPFSNSGPMTVHTGRGNDDVVINNLVSANTVTVRTGRGSDTVELSNNTISHDSRIAMGRGDDTLSLSASLYTNSDPVFHGKRGQDTFEDSMDNTFDAVSANVIGFEEIVDTSDPIVYKNFIPGDFGPADGIVISVDEETGNTGLELIVLDGTHAYGCVGVNVEGVADATVFHDMVAGDDVDDNGNVISIPDDQSGADKTQALVNTESCFADAAHLAQNFVAADGSENWYLPTASTLLQAANEGYLQTLNPGFRGYWSSSEVSNDSAWLVLDFEESDPNQPKTSNGSKSELVFVAVVREFGPVPLPAVAQ